MQHRFIHAGVVHLRDKDLRGTFQVVKQGGKILLRVGLSLVLPGQAADVSCPADISQPLCFRIDQRVVAGRGPVTHSPHRLVVPAELQLNRPHLLFEAWKPIGRIQRWEAVGVAVYYHIFILSTG